MSKERTPMYNLPAWLPGLAGRFLTANAGAGTSLVGNADLVRDVDFQNGPDSIVLRSSSGVLDALGYGDFAGGVFAGRQQPGPP